MTRPIGDLAFEKVSSEPSMQSVSIKGGDILVDAHYSFKHADAIPMVK